MKYLVKRLLLLFITFLGITLITYAIVRQAPGDIVSMKGGLEGELKQGSIAAEYMKQERELFGLNENIAVGYGKWLKKFLTLDLGNSRMDHRPVTTRLKEALPVTIAINIIVIILIYSIAIPLGIRLAVKNNSMYDRSVTIFLFVLYSIPAFWLALVLLTYFASGEYLNLFPLSGLHSTDSDTYGWFSNLLDMGWHIVLPVITMTIGGLAFISRYMKSSLLEVINQQYIITARAKGLSEHKVIYSHALRNSLIPLVTIFAGILPELIGGSVIIETIFSIPGMGKLAMEAIGTRDLPLIMAITAISAILTLIGILLSDITYSLVDPRIRIEGKEQ